MVMRWINRREGIARSSIINCCRMLITPKKETPKRDDECRSCFGQQSIAQSYPDCSAHKETDSGADSSKARSFAKNESRAYESNASHNLTCDARDITLACTKYGEACAHREEAS